MKLLTWVLIVFVTNNVFALTSEQIQNELQKFHKSPQQYYWGDGIPKKNKQSFKFSKKQRKTISFESNNFQKSAPRNNDLVENLLPYREIKRNILEIEKLGITEAKVKNLPWSDDYWPIYKGVVAARYNDEGFKEIFNWKEAEQYVLAYPYSLEFTQEELDNLSPAEKYDLLVSGNEFALTKYMWNQGRSFYRQSGEVENWMGICHGWAPASFMVPRPKHIVEVPSFDGKHLIKFFPSDIKALSSLLWANGEYDNNFVGGRCNDLDPQISDDDRIVPRDCLDNNPATMHLALINQIGIYKESFVIDATFDYEVWNQPMIGYNYKYFNPITKEEVTTANAAIVELKDVKDDKFKKYRARNAKYLVGIIMEAEYGVETSPTHREVDSKEFDHSNTAYYFYDLELDKNKNIIGGEWYNHQHPDFLWKPVRGAKASSYYDYYLMGQELWDGNDYLDFNAQSLAVRSAHQGQPLAYIVNSLVALAQKQMNLEGEYK